MRLVHWLGIALAIALTAGLPAAAATVSATGNMGDGNETVLPDGRKLFTGDEIGIVPPATLAHNDDLELYVDLTGKIGPYEIVFPKSRDPRVKESLHLEVNGKHLSDFLFYLWYKDENGKLLPYGGSHFVGGNVTRAQINEDVNVVETDLLGEPNDVQIRGFKLLIRNNATSDMQISSVKIGVDAASLLVATIPVPLPGALMASGVGVLLMARRRRTTHRA